MSETLKKPNEIIPENYSPQKPNILDIIDNQNKLSFTEKTTILTKSNGTPPGKSKIKGIHRLYYADKGENFVFDGCLRGVLEALGEPKGYDYNLMMALCGDIFTQMYNKDSEADCLTDNCFIPEISIHAFRKCGYDSVFITKDEIKRYPAEIMKLIKCSISRGVPVISMGVANVPVTVSDGAKIWNGSYPVVEGKLTRVPFASLIGGYEDDSLLVNVWIGEADTEENGYAKVQNSLDGSDGLILVGKKTSNPTLYDIYREIVYSIPVYLTLKPINGFYLGKAAFYEWADNIRNKTIMKYPDKWNLHFAPAVILYTNTGRAREFIDRAIKACPDFDLAQKLQYLYEKASMLCNELNRIQGGFDFDTARFEDEEFNKSHTNILYKLGDLQDEIIKAFS